jgi:AraC-like DNA-binding protein
MSDLIRSSALAGFPSLVKNLGGNPTSLLRRAKIDPGALECRDVPISFEAVIRLLEICAKALHCPDFGLRLAGKQDLRILGPVAIIGLNCPTVGEALAAMIEHIGFHSPLIVATIDRSEANRVLLTYDIALDHEVATRQVIELALKLYQGHMRTLIGGGYTPSGVLFRHSSPLSPSIYRSHFGMNVRFNQPMNALVVSPLDLERPLANVDPNLREIFAEYVKQNMALNPLEMRRQVAYYVRRLLPLGRCSIVNVAQCLYMHKRTLQRRLSEAKTTFEDIVDQARRERAQELIRNSKVTMNAIAEQLGYREQSSFNHACQRWFRVAPGVFKSATVRLRHAAGRPQRGARVERVTK